MNARPIARQIAHVLSQPGRARRPVGAPAAPPAGRGRRADRAADRDDRRQGDVRQLQHQHHPGGVEPHRRARRPGDHARPRRPARARLLRPARLPDPVRAGQLHAPAGVRRTRRRSRKDAIAAFTGGEANQVLLAYNEFKSVLQQRIVISQLLPIAEGAVRAGRPDGGGRLPLRAVARRRSSTACCRATSSSQIFTALLESAAAQNAAQMMAMDNATKNSGEVIDDADAVHEQGAAGGDHAGDHRGGVGRGGAVGRLRAQASALEA